MNITRNNYEEFFMLYADNELTAAERKTVEIFINENPDLKNELELFQQFKLNPDEAVFFEGKELLMKQENEQDIITIANYETFFVLYADDELSNTEKAAVEEFVYRHPQLQDSFELIQQARLTPDSHIVFENKESLYRKEEDDKVVPFTWWRIAVAALILLIAGMFWLMQAKKKEQPEIVKNKPTVTNPQLAPLHKEEDKIIADTNNNIQPEKETIAKIAPEKEIQRVKNVQPANLIKVAVKKEKNQVNNNLPALQNQPLKEDVAIQDPVNNQLKATTIPSFNRSENKALINTAMAAAADKSVVNQQLVYHSTVESDKAIAEQAVAYNDNNMEVLNTSVNTKKSSLRGFLRKASRMIGKKAGPDDDDSKHKSILIGGFEIAVR